jgi:hypothetical protein
VTFSTRMDPAPYNLSASEQDSLCAQLEKTFCWTGVRQIRLIRFIDARDRVTDTYQHNFTVQLLVEPSEQTADRHVQDDGALEVITAPEEFLLHISDLEPHAGFFEPGHPMHEPARPGLIRQLPEELGLVHTTVPVLHQGHTFDDHVFSVND